jgi:hypothetical protein
MADININEINRLAPIARTQYNNMNDSTKRALDTTWTNITGEPYQMKYGYMRSGWQMIVRRQDEVRPTYQILFTIAYADGGRRKTRRHKRKNLKLKKNKKSKKRSHRKR